MVKKSGKKVWRWVSNHTEYWNYVSIIWIFLLNSFSQIKINDEIDVINEIDEDNDDILIVGRIEILANKVDEETGLYHISIRKFKNMAVENYPGNDRFTRNIDD